MLLLITSLTSAMLVAGRSRPVQHPTALPVNCPGIQQAIDALPAAGGEVQLRAQTYVCSDPIVVARDGVTLRGSGAATVLRLADGANAPVLVLGSRDTIPATTYRNIAVFNLTIDGNRLNQTFECFHGPCSATNALRNNAISLRRVEDVTVDNVAVKSARSGGLVTELGVRRVRVHQFASSDNFFDGLAGYQTEDSVFDHLFLYDNASAGFSFDIAFNNNLLSNVVIENCGKVGIFMRDAKDNVFHGLQVRKSKEHGIFLAQVDTDATKPAAGNTFAAVVVADSAGAGIRVNDLSCINNSVIGAQLIGNAGGGLSEAKAGMTLAVGVITR